MWPDALFSASAPDAAAVSAALVLNFLGCGIANPPERFIATQLQMKKVQLLFGKKSSSSHMKLVAVSVFLVQAVCVLD
jgi:hypothetical protein